MGNDGTSRTDYSSVKPILLMEHIGEEEFSLLQSGVKQAYNYVLDNDPRFNNTEHGRRLKGLMKDKEVLNALQSFVTSISAGERVKKKTEEEAKKTKETKEEEIKQLSELLQAGATIGTLTTAGHGRTYADHIYELATHIDNPVARRQLINEALKQAQELRAQQQADKTPEGKARLAATEAKLTEEIEKAAKDSGKAITREEAGVLARGTAKIGRVGAQLGKFAAAGGPVGALAGLGMSSVSAGLVFASSYAMTGDAQQSAQDAVGAVVPVDAIAALTHGDYNASAAKLAGFYFLGMPGAESVAHYVLKKINPENGPGLFLNIGGRVLSASAKAALHRSQELLGMTPTPNPEGS